MTDLEIALRAAVNVLRDSAESGRMPSGLPLEGAALDMHQRAADQIETLVRSMSSGPDLAVSAFRRALTMPSP